tara:strand:- start:338 stop:520 length:183 start_codon:yes stop_codon:yes gene_type:complete
MDIKEQINTITQGLEKANKEGTFTMVESYVLYGAVLAIKHEFDKQEYKPKAEPKMEVTKK